LRQKKIHRPTLCVKSVLRSPNLGAQPSQKT
jgi:hypothetical protein